MVNRGGERIRMEKRKKEAGSRVDRKCILRGIWKMIMDGGEHMSR